ncbi:MAG: 2-C-methyl-D-erythritol 2,4-cyclodiphosphate synthase, partial [Bacteroidia bacterium]
MSIPRIGFGYDVHPLVANRPLILGGVHIPYDKGCQGHSDADVLIHAICDALLGAAALGDIGLHFPNTDARFQNISSVYLLEAVVNMLSNAGYTIGNIDATLSLEAPKVNPHVAQMRKLLCPVLKISEDS